MKKTRIVRLKELGTVTKTGPFVCALKHLVYVLFKYVKTYLLASFSCESSEQIRTWDKVIIMSIS